MKTVKDREAFLPLLKLADDSESEILSYLHEGDLFEIKWGADCAGVCLFTFPDEGKVEIKNIALLENWRGLGIGTEVLHWAEDYFKQRGFKQIIVGTANSSIANLAFYQKAGYRFYEIKRNYFASYDPPFYEHGIKGVDMVVFEKPLTRNES